MRSRLTVLILLVVCLIFALLFARQMYNSRDLPRDRFVQKKVRILTYSTFVGVAGPGGELIKNFKQSHGCDVEVTTTSDAGLLLERLKLSPGIDVVIGLDQILLAQAREQFQWKPFAIDHKGLHEEAELYGTDPFVPFDWSPMTFIFRGKEDPPKAFADLLDVKYRGMFALQDPRASSPGLQFFNWTKDIEGAKTAEFLEKFKPNVQSVSPSWAFSYGVFKKGQAHYVFSYLTSLAFHWGYEKNREYQAVNFPEGHPIQVEFAGVPATCQECDLGHDFVAAMITTDAQRIIMEKNFMLPAFSGHEKGTVFSELPALKARKIQHLVNREFDDWDQVFKH